jgi:hypothetical protein
MPIGIFCGHLVYFVVIWYILWSFGIFCGHLVYFFRFGMLYQEKSGNPDSTTITLTHACFVAAAWLRKPQTLSVKKSCAKKFALSTVRENPHQSFS